MEQKQSYDVKFLKLLTKKFTMRPDDIIQDDEEEDPSTKRKRIKLK